MKEAQRILTDTYRVQKDKRGYVIHRIKVKSHSDKDTEYMVVIYRNGEMECDCPAGFFGGVDQKHKHFEDALNKLFPAQKRSIERAREETRNQRLWSNQ